MSSRPGYKAIADYGVIGNLRSVALVGRDGSIDWCCLPRLDSPSVFGAMLDVRRGGRFSVAPQGFPRGEQAYLEDTNILQTWFQCGPARLEVTDLMPLSGDIRGCGGSQAEPEIHRILSCRGGDINVEIEWSPRLDYARAATAIERQKGSWLAHSPEHSITLGGLDQAEVRNGAFGPVLHARLHMANGDRRVLVTRWGAHQVNASVERSEHLLEQTAEAWRNWARQPGTDRSRIAGKHAGLLERSSLVLKLLTNAETGAMAAAATMGLPMRVGADCNYDYRYSWIRDVALTAQALIAFGHEAEARDALRWMERAAMSTGQWKLQIMYGLHGETELQAHHLDHLEGYRVSRPVRFGNDAARQFQLEVYGELLNTGYELVRRGEQLPEDVAGFFAKTADHVQDVWQRPDSGIWELHDQRQFTYSKVMAWVAMDRAAQLAEHTDIPGEPGQWLRTARDIRECIQERGYNRDLGAFVLDFDSQDLDAANLRIPLLEFLPPDDQRVQNTLDLTLERLVENGLVYRFETEGKRARQEAGFGLCTFWLVDVLCLAGRAEKAREIYDAAVARANHLLLLSEQFDPVTGEMLGNFPQAFSHIGVINSALYLAMAEGVEVPEPALIGTAQHRDSVPRTH